MTDAAVARRLFALLVDPDAVEGDPIAEIQADLVALGEESAGIVAMAKLIAAGAVSPATTLLARIDESEQGNQRLSEFEEPNRIDYVLGQPAGIDILLMQPAGPRVSENGPTTIQPHRRSRKIQYSIGAIAACVALFFIFSSSGPAVCQLGARFLPKSWCVSQHAIVALLIVDPKLAPAALKDAKLPQGDLAERLPEALRDAKERQVIALLSIRQPDDIVSDSVLLADIDLVLRTVEPVELQEPLPKPTPGVLSALEEMIGPLPSNFHVVDLAHR